MKMITREVVESIILFRDGKRVQLTTGQRFAFTQEEFDQIMSSNPKAVSATSSVDLDSGDVDLRKQGESEVVQKEAPAVPGQAEADGAPKGLTVSAAAAKKEKTLPAAAGKKAQSPTDSEL